MTRSEAVAANIARRIVRNKTRKHWARLHADALEEYQMSNPVNNDLTAVPQPRPTIGRESVLPKLPNHIAYPRMTEPASDSINSGMACQQNSEVRPVVIEKVDEGFYHATVSADPLAGNDRNPREQMGQFPLSGRQVAASKPVSTDDLEGVGG
jgi:hypothetical protein